MKRFLFRCALQGIHIYIESNSLEGAKAILDKLVVQPKIWENYN